MNESVSTVIDGATTIFIPLLLLAIVLMVSLEFFMDECDGCDRGRSVNQRRDCESVVVLRELEKSRILECHRSTASDVRAIL
jgi:hypothetical protein